MTWRQRKQIGRTDRASGHAAPSSAARLQTVRRLLPADSAGITLPLLKDLAPWLPALVRGRQQLEYAVRRDLAGVGVAHGGDHLTPNRKAQ